MSRIHEALRKAAYGNSEVPKPELARTEVFSELSEDTPISGTAVAEPVEFSDLGLDAFGQIIRNAREISFDPPSDALLVNPDPADPTESIADNAISSHAGRHECIAGRGEVVYRCKLGDLAGTARWKTCVAR
jgi:hypothetical protein